jgi:hypothetical protein
MRIHSAHADWSCISGFCVVAVDVGCGDFYMPAVRVQ